MDRGFTRQVIDIERAGTRTDNVEDSLGELNALAVLGMGILQSVLMLGTLLLTYKIPGHSKVRSI